MTISMAQFDLLTIKKKKNSLEIMEPRCFLWYQVYCMKLGRETINVLGRAYAELNTQSI